MYKCNTCNYNTDNIKKFDRHIYTKKHKNNIMHRNNDILINNFICEYCNKLFKHKSTMYTHKKKCTIYNKIINDNNNDDDIKNNNINNNIINKIENKGNEIKLEINNVKLEINNVKLSVDKAIRTTSSLIKYLMTNYSHVKPLNQLTQDQCQRIIYTAYGCNNNKQDKLDNKLNNKEYDLLMTKLLLDFEKNRLYIYIGNIIYTIVSETDKNKQAIWSSDTSRLNYAIKITIDKWYNDHAGEKFCDFVITPISNYIYKIIDIFQTNFWNSDINNDTNSDINNNEWSKIIKLNEIKDYIKSNIFRRDILRYLASKLQFLEEEFNTMTNICNVEKYKKIIHEERDKKLLTENNKEIIDDILDDIYSIPYENPYIDGFIDSDSDDYTPYNNYATFHIKNVNQNKINYSD